IFEKTKPNENTRKFCEEMINLGETVQIEEELLVQTILSNLDNDKKILYKLHINKKYTIKRLYELVELIDEDDTERAYKSSYEDFEAKENPYQNLNHDQDTIKILQIKLKK
ncbi:hypothetical protein GVAV_000482, partial [Gurleya vavrai]